MSITEAERLANKCKILQGDMDVLRRQLLEKDTALQALAEAGQQLSVELDKERESLAKVQAAYRALQGEAHRLGVQNRSLTEHNSRLHRKVVYFRARCIGAMDEAAEGGS